VNENGKLPDSVLAPIPGGKLRKDAAIAWTALRAKIGKEQGVWICPTSPRTAYRPYADQEFFWKLYKSGNGALAAQPGTSNHGWGIAVDIPTAPMQAALRTHGHAFGWGIRGGKLASDAPSEAWHCTFHTDVYAPPAAEDPAQHAYHALTDKERAARDALIAERRTAKRHGGWEKIDSVHLRRAAEAKRALAQYARDITAAAKDTGWEKAERKVRLDYINQLIGA